MDSYQVKLMARARRDLDGIYAYIAGTFLEPDTAIKMIEALEEGITHWSPCHIAVRNGSAEAMQIRAFVSCSSRTIES